MSRDVESTLNIIIGECEHSRTEALRKPGDLLELGKAYAYSIMAIFCRQLLAEEKKATGNNNNVKD